MTRRQGAGQRQEPAAAGIKDVVGQFERGDLIGVRGADGREIAEASARTPPTRRGPGRPA